MTGTITAYDLLVGVGTLYVAAAGTAMPALTATPSGSWRALGETDGGVKVTKTQNMEAFSSDQRTGNVKAVRTEEGLTVETSLLESTLENLADVINGTVTTTPAGTGVIGKKSSTMYKGGTVSEFALLFRGSSAYGAFPAQFYVPRGFFNDDVEMEFLKDDKTVIPVKFEALEYLSASTDAERFGVFEHQTAAAT
jgi:hypothetical protein